LLALLLGGILGYISWGNSLVMTIFSLILFLVYLLCNNRQNLFLFALGYYLIASRGLFFGVDEYTHNLFYAFFSWSGVAFLSALSWVIVWSKEYYRRLFLFPLVLLLTILPPIGFISGVNPLVTIAVVLPKFGFWGLFFEIVALYLISTFLHSTNKCNTPKLIYC